MADKVVRSDEEWRQVKRAYVAAMEAEADGR